MREEIENLEFVRGVNFEFIESIKNNGKGTCCFLTTLVKIYAFQMPLLRLPPLGDFGV